MFSFSNIQNMFMVTLTFCNLTLDHCKTANVSFFKAIWNVNVWEKQSTGRINGCWTQERCPQYPSGCQRGSSTVCWVYEGSWKSGRRWPDQEPCWLSPRHDWCHFLREPLTPPCLEDKPGFHVKKQYRKRKREITDNMSKHIFRHSLDGRSLVVVFAKLINVSCVSAF